MAVSEPASEITLLLAVGVVVCAAAVEEYARQGAVCLRGVFSPRWVDAVRDAIEWNLQHPSQYVSRHGTGEPFIIDAYIIKHRRESF